MQVNFIFTKRILQASFRDVSREVPEGSTYHWDFGDLVTSSEVNPVHSYAKAGFYLVTLTITKTQQAPLANIVGVYKTTLGVNNLASTSLSDSIYNLINTYLPSSLTSMSNFEYGKRIFIEKWQLYISPLVSHDIPIEEYNNELYYEALENQLVMELAIYDWANATILSLLNSTAQNVQGNLSSSDTAEPSVKKIVTGPSEVEFQNTNADAAEFYKALTTAMKPGGSIDLVKQNICMLASRLSIYLPICSRPNKTIIVPEVVNNREPKFLDGPNPPFTVKK